MTAKARRRFYQSTGRPRPKRTEHNLTVRTGKPDAEVTNNKIWRSSKGKVNVDLYSA